MSLRIRRLKILVISDQGNFGTDIAFPDGLVLLRADNTTGKSTCIKAIIYALGLERMFGPANKPPLTPAMTSLLEEGTQKRHVLESSVFLEIENGLGQHMTIVRQVTGGDQDWRLVKVWDGPMELIKEQDGKNYYVRDPGSASREAGFYTKLANFIGWEIPEVIRYDGVLVPFYMECLLPLFYVEQRHGWSSIQATTPRFFQIREVDKKAIEFLLNLDGFSQDMERQKLAQQESDLKKKWETAKEASELLANSYGTTIRNLPSNPVIKWPLENSPYIELYRNNIPISLQKAIQEDKEAFKKIEENDIPSAEQTVSETESQLQSARGELFDSELLEADIADNIKLEENELKGLEVRLHALHEDLKKNQDIERLRSYGATANLRINSGFCPTCHQSITDALLIQNQDNVVMTVPENIEYIRSQIQTFERMQARVSSSFQIKQRRMSAAQDRSMQIRARIRVLKRTLLADGRIPSIAALQERMSLEDRIEKLSALEEKFIGKLGIFEELSLDWKHLQIQKKKLAADLNNTADKEKLGKLEKLFIEYEGLFGFSSFPPKNLSLSQDTYRPTREGFDVVYDISASDNVRTICSYLLASLNLTREFITNHPGLMILDEPRQQNLVWSDFTEVLRTAAKAKEMGHQIIVATSDTVDRVNQIKDQIDCHCISFTGKILKKLEE